MATISLPHFGLIDPAALEEYYDADINFNNTSIQVDLNFDGPSIESNRLVMVKQFVDNLRIHDLKNKQHIVNDYNNPNGDTVKFYIEHHLEELGENELAELVDVAAPLAEKEQQLLKKLRLVRVGLYPDHTSQFATFDYSIGKEMTDQLVVIITDENGNLDYLKMES